jgi:PhoH-like ATPase
LLDDAIQLVTLVGPAGTGKTFLTLLAALHKVLVEDAYEKVLISRPVVPLGRDIGYLPGTLEEKLHSWMLPIYDNIEFMMHEAHSNAHMKRVKDEQRGKKRGPKKGKREHSGLDHIDELIRKHKLSLEAITYMRGRSIPYQFILIDEVQNLTPHEVKTLVSRVGKGSKIVLAGDPYQIDSPYLDFSSNGLMVTSEKLKGQSLFASVYLQTSERGELSQLANDLL